MTIIDRSNNDQSNASWRWFHAHHIFMMLNLMMRGQFNKHTLLTEHSNYFITINKSVIYCWIMNKFGFEHFPRQNRKKETAAIGMFVCLF